MASESCLSMSNVSTSSLIGVGIACGGNMLISLALNIQKLAHKRNEQELNEAWDANAENEDEEEDEECPGGSRRPRDPLMIPEEDEPPPTPQLHSPYKKNTVVLSDTTVLARQSDTGDVGEEDQRPKTVPVILAPNRTMSDPAVLLNESCNNTLSTSTSESPRAPSPAPIYPAKYTPPRVRLRSPSPPSSPPSSQHDGMKDDAPLGCDGGPPAGKVEEGTYLRSKLWWAGMVLIALGEGGNFLSYGFAPASVVAPLGTVALIANCVFAPLVLGERFCKKEFFGMALAIVGAITVVWSSSTTSPRLDPDELLKALSSPSFLIYTLFNILLLLPLLYLSDRPFGHRHLSVNLGICAIFGGYTVLATKALSSLLSRDLFGAWRAGVTWECALVVGGTSLGQVRWLNRALMGFESKEVIPTQFVFFTLSAIIGSAVLYQEFRDIALSRLMNFAFGIATTFLGVHLLTSTSSLESSTLPSDTGENPASARGNLSRATSSSSVNLLLPTSSSLGTANERTAILHYFPAPMSSTVPRRLHDAPTAGRAYTAPLGAGFPTTTPGSAMGPGRIRLGKRGSTGDFTAVPVSKLPISSQGGILLLATTPPNPPPWLGGGRGRVWSSSGGDEEAILGGGGAGGWGGLGVGLGARGRSKSLHAPVPHARDGSSSRHR